MVRNAGAPRQPIAERHPEEGSAQHRTVPRPGQHKKGSAMAFTRVRLLLVCLPIVLAAPDVSAHDSWISRGAHKNAAGEWCCGEGDCFIVPPEQVRVGSTGYNLYGMETVPFSEAQ